MPPDVLRTWTQSKLLVARSIVRIDETYRAIERSRAAIAQSRQRLARVPAPDAVPQVAPPRRAKPKHNKLTFKNRWLVSASVVAALRRAGVDCSIVVSDEDGGLRVLPLSRHESGDTRH